MPISQTLLGYYSQSLCDDLSPKYGSQLESLFRVEKMQLIGAIGLWMADCSENPEIDWLSLGDHAATNGTVFEHFDAWDIVQNECNFAEPQRAMPLLKALVAQLDYEIYLRN
jgi:hypothetical protein